mmetsp:Transcript_49144/g.110625  ORF Transcript_49144/g.110625 Transcript_49144/m.110625 type:complete len:298 (-) Transcript_49144:84-977(-)
MSVSTPDKESSTRSSSLPTAWTAIISCAVQASAASLARRARNNEPHAALASRQQHVIRVASEDPRGASAPASASNALRSSKRTFSARKSCPIRQTPQTRPIKGPKGDPRACSWRVTRSWQQTRSTTGKNTARPAGAPANARNVPKNMPSSKLGPANACAEASSCSCQESLLRPLCSSSGSGRSRGHRREEEARTCASSVWMASNCTSSSWRALMPRWASTPPTPAAKEAGKFPVATPSPTLKSARAPLASRRFCKPSLSAAMLERVACDAPIPSFDRTADSKRDSRVGALRGASNAW